MQGIKNMAYTFDSNIVSDLHKDARGYRPNEYFWEEWTQCGDDARQMIWDSLCQELEDSMAAERDRESRALEVFRAQIAETRAMGAYSDREAIRWILDAERLDEHDLAYGADYVAWNLGLAYDNPYKAVIQEAINQMLAEVAE